MIQRVQSIWLLMAALTLIGLLFLPLLTKNVNGMEYSIYTGGLHQQMEGASGSGMNLEFFFVPLALNIAAALFCFAGIFLFRNRSMQKKVTLVAILMMIALCVLCGINGQQLPNGIVGVSAKAGVFLPIVAILFSLLAIRGIRKDEQLLRSADRLR